MTMILETERLILRPWQASDAETLYQYASDPRVGPSAGWPVHTSVAHSLDVIRGVLSAPETYAMVPKRVGHAVGSIGLMIGEASNLDLSCSEGEIGYWIGVPFWGQGLVPEAVYAVIRRGFADLGLDKLWCGYFEGNANSRRVQEKCGFTYHHTIAHMICPQMDAVRTEHVTCLPREVWTRRTAAEDKK